MTQAIVSPSPSTPLSSPPSLRHVALTWPRPGVVQLSLNRPPVNALDRDFWEELLRALTYIEDFLFPHHTRVLVITSSLQSPIFTAGHDLSELHAPCTTKARFASFWIVSTRFLTRLYTTPLATVAAPRGATPAGGCAICLCCDYRIALQDMHIGLNETALGIAVPKYWAKLFVSSYTPASVAEMLLMKGDFVDAETALKAGLVQKVVKGTKEDLENAALEYARKWAAITHVRGRVNTKIALRKQFGTEWFEYAATEARLAWKQLSEKDTVEELRKVRQRLSAPKL